MIPRNNVRKKDFSLDLPVICDKLHALAAGLANTAYNEETMEGPAVSGVAHILLDVTEDLRTINEVLYGDSVKSPEHKGSGMDQTEKGRER